MKSIKATAILLLLLLGSSTATTAWADRYRGAYYGPRVEYGHFHGGYYGSSFGFGLGVGLALDGWPGYYPYGYYRYGPYPYAGYPTVIVTQPAAPTVYMEQGDAAPAQGSEPRSNAPTQGQAPNDWYYCRNPAGYYPYVRSCAEGWQRVPAQPQEPQSQN